VADAPLAPEAHEDPVARRVEHARGAVNRLKVLMDPLRRGDEEQIQDLTHVFVEQIRETLVLGPLALRIDADGIWLGEHELTGRDLVGKVLTEGMSGEGLEQVTVLVSVPDDEIRALARMLARDWRDRVPEEPGLEAQAWAAGFGHVLLEVGARSVIDVVDEGDIAPEEMVARLISQLGVQVTDAEVAGALDAEVGAVMDQLRAIGAGATDASSLAELQEEPAHQAFQRELQGVLAGADVGADRIALVIFEAVRAAPDAAHAAETIRGAGYHLRIAAADGDVETAGAIARRLATLVQPGLFPGWALAGGVSDALGDLLDAAMAQAVAAGTRRNPDREAWRGLLFSLGQLASPARLDAILQLGRPLPQRGMRQALADAMLLVADRGQTDLRQVLAQAADADLAVVLLALGRRPDPTLVELILAREGSKDAQVREAVLIALRAHQSPRIKEVMRSAVEDEVAAVRMEALRYLSVYRDAAAADKVQARLLAVGERDADEAELRALAIASAIMTRGAGLVRLEEIATGVAKCKHPQAPRAALHGLKAGGAAGREALERIGRSQPALRGDIRSLLGGTR
jgi:hypothetical protein